MTNITLHDLWQAAGRIAPFVHRTPVLQSRLLDKELGAALYFKCENLQYTGSFKIRGATNAVRSLGDDEAARGVATHSSGNHGAALAAAAAARGIPAFVVVPDNAVAAKAAAIAHYGGKVIPCAPTYAARVSGLERLLDETGAVPVHPYDDERIICGQGTAALEFLEEVPDLDVLIAPVGGGGLISGCALAGRALRPRLEVIGAEPAGADDTARSLAAGGIVEDFHPDTVADGLRAKVGIRNFDIIRRHVDAVITVDDDEILAAMRDIWHIMKIIVEPSSATVLAAARKLRGRLQNRKAGLVLSGGNADLDAIAFCSRCGDRAG